MKAWPVLLIALAAAPAAAHDMPVRLTPGATWTLVVEQARETERGGKTQVASAVTTKRLVWRPGELTVHPVSSVATTGGGRQDIPSLDIPIVLTVDDALTPEDVRNKDEVRAAVEALIRRAAPMVKDVETLMPGLVDASMTAVLTADLTRVALAQGSSLNVGEDQAYEDALPNPMGGPPITSKASFRLESYDAKAGRAVIVWRQALDPESTKASLSAALTALTAKVAPDKVEEARAAFAKMTMRRDDTCRHEIDLATGLAVRAVCTSETLIGSAAETGRRTDRWTLTQTPPQPSAKLDR